MLGFDGVELFAEFSANSLGLDNHLVLVFSLQGCLFFFKNLDHIFKSCELARVPLLFVVEKLLDLVIFFMDSFVEFLLNLESLSKLFL